MLRKKLPAKRQTLASATLESSSAEASKLLALEQDSKWVNQLKAGYDRSQHRQAAAEHNNQWVRRRRHLFNHRQFRRCKRRNILYWQSVAELCGSQQFEQNSWPIDTWWRPSCHRTIPKDRNNSQGATRRSEQVWSRWQWWHKSRLEWLQAR